MHRLPVSVPPFTPALRPVSAPAPAPALPHRNGSLFHSIAAHVHLPWRRPIEVAWSRRYRLRLRISDSLIVVGSVLAAMALTAYPSEPGIANGTITGTIDSLLPVILVASWLVSLGAHRTRDARIVGIGLTEYRRIVQATATTFGLLAILFQALDVSVSRGYFVLVLALGLLALTGERWLWRNWLFRRREDGNYLSRAIVVGKTADVEYVIDQIAKNPGAGYRVHGAATDGAVGTVIRRFTERIPIVAGLGDVALVARTMRADVVVVAGQPNNDAHYVKKLAWQLEGSTAELVLASRLTDVAGPRIHFRPVEGLPLVHVELPQYEGGKHFAKRALDVVVSGIAILVLLPVMVAIGLIIRRDSAGPALFSQLRVGRGGEAFRMLKFRSMGVDAEARLDELRATNEGAGALFKLRSDPRVTRVGRVLRKYSLDELPQLWNIFVGDMSLVGPRPPLESEVEEYERHVRRRLFIKPGLTGMWQVNGRSDLDWEESVRLDLYYVENWSLTGDLLILWRTAKVVFTSQGAY